MKHKKTIPTAAAGFLCAVCLCSCGNTVRGTEGMLAYMCEKHGDGLRYSGSVSNASETVAWFTFDEYHPTCSYMVFRNNGNDEYEPYLDPKLTMDSGACYCLWNKGIALHIENTDIAEVTVLSDRAETLKVTEYPFNAYVGLDGGLNGIYCVDKDGKPVGDIQN
jgi:hypothetical protein